jgi:peptidoglycan/xylan/chitin deacetylase (PgdA/CDA1 family)
MRKLLKAAVEHVATLLPRAATAGDRIILAYHGVLPDGASTAGERALHLPEQLFRQQMEWLRRETDVVPLMELLESGRSRARLAAVTFDDAYATALDIGAHTCDALDLPCTVFVASNLLTTVPVWDRRAEDGAWSESSREEFLWSQRGYDAPVPQASWAAAPFLRIADEDHLRRAVSRYRRLTLGNHTRSHSNLGALTAEEVVEEIEGTSHWLETLAPHQTVPVLAYPYGIPPAITSPAALAGMRFALRVSGGWIQAGHRLDPFHVPRWNIPAGLSLRGFRARLRGRLGALGEQARGDQ